MFPSVHTENLFPWGFENNGFNNIMMHFHKLPGSKEQKKTLYGIVYGSKTKIKKERWEREILLCILFKNLQNLLRLERPQHWTPYSSFLSFSGNKTQQFFVSISFWSIFPLQSKILLKFSVSFGIFQKLCMIF